MKSREQSLFAGLLQKQSRTQLAIILGVVAMLLILFSELFSTPAKTAANAGSSAAVSETAYREQLETQLTELIEQLDGAGKTVVMVTLESGEETIYAVDTQSGQMQNQETHVLLEDGSALEETTYLPAVCGYLVQKEVSIMGKALSDPERPFVAILGGAKVSDKLNVINNLLEKVDTLIIGGGMAYTFLAAKGYGIGKSLFDAEKVDYCKDMMKKAEEKGVKLLLPVDTVISANFPDPIDAPIDVKTVSVDAIPADMEGMDIGEKTRELFADAVKNAKTVVWNGPMGVFENPTLAKGTIAMAQALADSSATTIVGGGDSAAACEQLGFADKITHISTGGGASLEFLEGLELPGIACLQDK